MAYSGPVWVRGFWAGRGAEGPESWGKRGCCCCWRWEKGQGEREFEEGFEQSVVAGGGSFGNQCGSVGEGFGDSGSAPGEEVAEMVAGFCAAAGVGAECGAVSEGSQLVDSRSVLSGDFGISSPMIGMNF